MTTAAVTALVLDLAGTFAFALNGALTAVRAARLDIVGVVTLGMITALGGGIVRDILLGALPPATFNDWRYLAVAAGGGLLAFALSRQLERLATPIEIFDALGLSLFAVTGAAKAMTLGAGAGQAILLGAITAVGGGTIRDVLVRRVPTVLSSELYAIPALLGAAVVVLGTRAGLGPLLPALAGAGLCLLVRLIGLRFRLDAPHPPGRAG
ncbi:trimeric intracellular cation channel family protein [Actinomycetospora rhizophila]|uniref:Trimeric intracellular cation channel family protein n=1 Tax=Actinomycetospora rhizophila TaxID=1416876 RepID=A0ABV9ZLE7_9PSEU